MSETELTPEEREAVAIGDYKYGFHDEVTSVFPTRRGLDRDVVREISAHKSEPEWMLDFRLKSHEHFLKRPMPQWGADLSTIDFDNIYYYLKPVDEQAKSWDDVPDGHAARRWTSWASPRPRRSTWPASARSTSPRSSTTACRRTSPSRA